jgi:hypothetical protein
MRPKESTVFFLLLVLSLLIRSYFTVAIPTWQSPDEYPHYWIIKNIADNNRLPTSTADFPSYEAFQPPLYYIISASIAKLFPEDIPFSTRPSPPPREIVVLRFLSVVAGLLCIYFSYRIYKNIPNLQPSYRLLSVAFLSVLPTFVGVTTTINNDAFAILFSAISLMYIVKSEWTTKTALWSGFWAGIALLTKMSSMALVPILLFRIYQLRSVEKNLKFRWSLLAFLAWSLGASALVLRNIVQYERVFVLNPAVETQFAFSLRHLLWAIRNLTWSFFLAFGRIYQVRPPAIVYIITIIPLLMAAVYGSIRVIHKHSELLQLILVSIICGVSSSLYYTCSYPRGTMSSWGKNLYPILPLIAIFLIVGCNSVFRRRSVLISVIVITIMALGCFWALLEFHKMLA